MRVAQLALDEGALAERVPLAERGEEGGACLAGRLPEHGRLPLGDEVEGIARLALPEDVVVLQVVDLAEG